MFRHSQLELGSGCSQVGKLYIRYELEDSDCLVVQDVNCVLKDQKELYIQKDHLTAKLEICRCVCVRPKSHLSFLPVSPR